MTPLALLLATAVPLLLPSVRNAILGVEHALGGGTGPTKLSIVEAIITAVANALSTAGRIPGVLDAASILVMIETMVAALKHSGELPSGTTPATPGASYKVSGTLTLGTP